MKADALSQSRNIIQLILDDIAENYPFEGGGGIAFIHQDATWIYSAAITQEERVDLITYTLERLASGKLVIKNKQYSTQ